MLAHSESSHESKALARHLEDLHISCPREVIADNATHLEQQSSGINQMEDQENWRKTQAIFNSNKELLRPEIGNQTSNRNYLK